MTPTEQNPILALKKTCNSKTKQNYGHDEYDTDITEGPTHVLVVIRDDS